MQASVQGHPSQKGVRTGTPSRGGAPALQKAFLEPRGPVGWQSQAPPSLETVLPLPTSPSSLRSHSQGGRGKDSELPPLVSSVSLRSKVTAFLAGVPPVRSPSGALGAEAAAVTGPLPAPPAGWPGAAGRPRSSCGLLGLKFWKRQVRRLPCGWGRLGDICTTRPRSRATRTGHPPFPRTLSLQPLHPLRLPGLPAQGRAGHLRGIYSREHPSAGARQGRAGAGASLQQRLRASQNQSTIRKRSRSRCRLPQPGSPEPQAQPSTEPRATASREQRAAAPTGCGHGPHLVPERGLQLAQLLLLPLQQVTALLHGRLHLIQVPGLLQSGGRGTHTHTWRDPHSSLPEPALPCWPGHHGE